MQQFFTPRFGNPIGCPRRRESRFNSHAANTSIRKYQADLIVDRLHRRTTAIRRRYGNDNTVIASVDIAQNPKVFYGHCRDLLVAYLPYKVTNVFQRMFDLIIHATTYHSRPG